MHFSNFKEFTCTFSGTENHIALEEGNDVGSYAVDISLEDCKILCDATTGCNSFSYASDAKRCYPKDGIVTASSPTRVTGQWTTYYRVCGMYLNLKKYV